MGKIAYTSKNSQRDGRRLFSVYVPNKSLAILNYYSSVHNVSKSAFVAIAIDEKIKRDCPNLLAETTTELTKLLSDEFDNN